MLRLLWAKIRCNLYLAIVGMWRGETMAQAWSKDGRQIWVAAVLSEPHIDHSKIVKTFFQEP
jgi:hypothetical protein